MSIRQRIAKWLLGIDVERIERRLAAIEGYICEEA